MNGKYITITVDDGTTREKRRMFVNSDFDEQLERFLAGEKTVPMMRGERYSEVYKRIIHGDDTCPFWRPKDGGICLGWQGEIDHICAKQHDGSLCPVFKYKGHSKRSGSASISP